MNVLLIGLGTSGDIFPYVALGKALKQQNHRVTIITNEFFRNLVLKNGLEYFQVGSASEYEQISQNQHFFHSSKAFGFAVNHIILKYMRPVFEAIALLAGDNTLIISQSLTPGARIAHEKFKIPLITLNLQPFTLWSYVNPPVFPGMALPDLLPVKLRIKLLKKINESYIDKKFADGINLFLNDLNLPAQRNFFSQWMYSPQIVLGAFPEWFAPPAEDWPRNTHLTGFISLNDDSELPEKVNDLIKSGKPLVVITFGSAMQHAGFFLIQLSERWISLV